ncbi:hypothetical protein D9611_005240 [Ephemerocybe angulata]|uniref:Gfo/Idh/MocA-like oxidoreductase N-terminal domain-containing protein n=1 Tax=Ephemerocybe angulata TaxID=980116 RepID=A0A8H5FDU2_9AGAR|nr:hypothetical protein D9611_005240 [Tulosesus angulatus]
MSTIAAKASKGPIKLGFVGLSADGWASMALGPSLLDPQVRERYRLVAIATTNETSAKASARKYSELFGHEIKAYHNVDALAADPDVEFVAISVSPAHHNNIVPKVIARGKPFFLEWQPGKGIEDTKTFAKLAREKGVESFIGVQGRQSNALKKIKRILETGTIGKLFSVNINLLFPREMNVLAPNCLERYAWVLEKDSDLNLVTALGHFLDNFTQVLGPLSRVSASGTTLFPTIFLVDNTTHEPTGKTVPSHFPDHITITGVLKDSGAWVTINLRLGHPSTPGRTQLLWEIDGEKGAVKLEDTRPMGAHINSHDPESIYLNGEKLVWSVKEDGEAFESPTPFLRSAWLEFLKGKEGGGYFMDIEEAVKHRELLQAIETSLFDGGRWIKL